MIFVTVGVHMPFDRLVHLVDDWAGQRSRDDVFAQIGDTDLRPANIAWKNFLDGREFRQRVESADAVVAHAGMGSIITALELGKPILVMPRKAELQEQVNDHQLDTARKLQELGYVSVGFEDRDMFAKLDSLSELRCARKIAPCASKELLNAIRSFVNT
jgi:UDP-N-acetylglucosamine transferase subunit ALG13